MTTHANPRRRSGDPTHASRMDGTAFDPDGQARRRDRLQRLHRGHWFDRFDDRGEYVAGACDDYRQRMWHAASFLAGGEPAHVRRANAMLGHVLAVAPDHFWSSGVATILGRFSARLDAGLGDALRDRLAATLPREARQVFRGYNDNYPAMAAFSAIVGGEFCDQPEAVAGGIASLQSLRELLARRGCITEYASPTYSAITLMCLASIVELARHPEARDLALAGEQRIWLEVLARFHPATSSIAGPHSRAYMVDMVAHTHNVHVVLHQVLGEPAFVNPVSSYFPPIDGHADHNANTDGMAHGIDFTFPTYHPPSEAIDLALHGRSPATFEAETEQAAFPRNVWEPTPHPETPYAEFQAGTAHLVTHLADDFALGTASRMCMDGYQNTSVHLVYRRRRPTPDGPPRLKDVVTLFSRFLQNDRPIDRHAHLGDEGRTLCLQHDATALVAAWPKLGWGSRPALPDATVEPTRGVRLTILIPSFWGEPDEVWLGDRRCDGWRGEAAAPVAVFIRHGPVMIALHPLAIDRAGGSIGPAMRLHQCDGFSLLDLINFQADAPRRFTPAELLGLRNGYVINVASTDDIDFAEFRRRSALARVTDRDDRADGMRYCRYQSGRMDGLSLGMAFSPLSEGIKYREINGRVARPPTEAAIVNTHAPNQSHP